MTEARARQTGRPNWQVCSVVLGDQLSCPVPLATESYRCEVRSLYTHSQLRTPTPQNLNNFGVWRFPRKKAPKQRDLVNLRKCTENGSSKLGWGRGSELEALRPGHSHHQTLGQRQTPRWGCHISVLYLCCIDVWVVCLHLCNPAPDGETIK